MTTTLLVGSAIAAAALGLAAPASAQTDNPFSHLCMVSQCPAPAPTTVRHWDPSQVQAGIQRGLQSIH
ncbi:Uncharacterised protein [Mycobacterium tuberculosis]|nr:Uncharacterised protein [Mycobacterium tuberculosis]